MLNPTGTYVWHRVEDENNIKGPVEDQIYLVCTEQSDIKGSCWHLNLARWYDAGARLDLQDLDGTVHSHKIDKDGFYLIPEVGGCHVYLIHGVQYWTEIKSPNVDPDTILTIVG